MQIPVHVGFGQSTPRQADQIPRGALQTDVSSGVQDIAKVGMQVAGEQMHQEAVDAKQAQRDAEAEARQQAREAAMLRREADKAKALTVMNGVKDQLADLHDEVNAGVQTGAVDKTKAEASYNTQAKKLIDQASGSLPDDHRDLVMAQLGGVADRLTNGVRKAVSLRDRQDVTAGITQTLEYLQRQYPKNPAGATAQMEQTVDQLGPFSTLTPDQLAKTKQGFKEGAQFTTGYEMVSAGRNDRKALDAAEKTIASNLPDLDPQKRAVLMDRVQAYRMALDQKAEMAAARAAREEERRLKQAEAQFNVFQAMADKGTVLDPAYIDRTLQMTAGTPFAAAVKALAEDARNNGGLAAQPISEQRTALAAIDANIAKNGRTDYLDKRRDQIQKILHGSQTALQSDGLQAGLERGVITSIKPIDVSQGIPGLVSQLGKRVQQAQRVGVWAGQPVSPLTSPEAVQVKTMLDALPAKEKSVAVAALAGAIGPQQAQGLAAQLDQKDRALALAFASAGTATTQDRLVSELILKGAQAQKDGTSTKNTKDADVKVARWSAEIVNQLAGVYPNQQTADGVRDAAMYISHGMAAEAGGALSVKDRERAVRLAVGGSLLEHNGRTIPLPAGTTPDMLEQRLRSISPQEIRQQAPSGKVRVQGVEIPVEEFAKTLPGQQLQAVGQGKYAVIVGGRYVTNAAGQPTIIQLGM